MAINYRKNGVDLEGLIELFPSNITSQTIINNRYHDTSAGDSDNNTTETANLICTESALTSENKYYQDGNPLAYFAPSVIDSTEMLAYGENPILGRYKANGSNISAAPYGCRPIGILLNQITTPGTYYISRKDGKTYFSTSEAIGSGSLLSGAYNPKYIVVELQGAGGGGGGASSGAGGQGGCGGAYVACGVYIDENAPIQIVVGSGGARGESDKTGNDGVGTSLTATINGARFTVTATGGHRGIRATGDDRDYSDTKPNTSSVPTNSDKFVLLTAQEGPPGSGKDNDLGMARSTTFNYPQPEIQPITRGPYRIGYSGSWSGGAQGYGGGGGASYFHDGAYPRKGERGVAGTSGAGGSGGSYKAFNRNPGGKGGDGLAIIYY